MVEVVDNRKIFVTKVCLSLPYECQRYAAIPGCPPAECAERTDDAVTKRKCIEILSRGSVVEPAYFQAGKHGTIQFFVG